MTTFIVDNPRFEIVEYIKKLRKAGATQELAEVQAQELEHVINDVLKHTEHKTKEFIDNKELATKLDIKETKLEIKELEVKIALVESRLIRWVVGVGVSAPVTLCGAIFAMLKFMPH